MNAFKLSCSCAKESQSLFVIVSLAKTFEELHSDFFRKGRLHKVQVICRDTRIKMTCESYIELAFYSTSNNVGKQPGLGCYYATENAPHDFYLIKRYKTFCQFAHSTVQTDWLLTCLHEAIWQGNQRKKITCCKPSATTTINGSC